MPSQHDRRAGPGQAGIPARKRWGQHFLASPDTAERIVAAARVGSEGTVLEIGPGEGALTRPLSARARRLIAVEIDRPRATLAAIAMIVIIGLTPIELGNRLPSAT